MKLQIALDTLTLEECITLMNEVQDYVDIIEVGTPFIIEEGMRPVRELKRLFPKLEVLADAKIMDAGELEAETAFKAGADIVTVLGVSNDATIKGALDAAKKYNGKVLIDMICVADMAQRVKEIDAMGAHYLCCHTAFDVQDTGKTPLDELIVINANVKDAKSAVAGGVKLETVDAIVAEGAEIVIVGGAITNAPNRAEMAKLIKERLK